MEQEKQERLDRLTEAVNELSLEAHPSKTVNVIIGSKKLRREIKEELERELMVLQGFPVQSKESDAYLGMVFAEGGARESIDASIEIRVAKAKLKTKQAKLLLKDTRIQDLGWLDTVRTMYINH